MQATSWEEPSTQLNWGAESEGKVLGPLKAGGYTGNGCGVV